MIDIKNITQKDIGKWVKYIGNPEEKGRIKSYNSKFVFVVYKCAGEWDRFKEYTGVATNPEHLIFLKGDDVHA